MDFFAHGFWSFLIFHKKSWKYWAILFGILPDLASWFIFAIYNMITRQVDWGNHANMVFPDWIWTLYGLSHSIIIFAVIAIIIWIITGKMQFVILPWLIHILIDIPTHSRKFLPTPFLWPVSDWYFPGFSWGQTWFMILNYCLLILGYGYFFIARPCLHGALKKELIAQYAKGKKIPCSLPVIIATLVLIVLVSVFDILWMKNSTNMLLVSIGIALFISGYILRFVSHKNLGRQFTYEVQIIRKHKLITSGIHRYIRHPAYIGLFFMAIGATIAINSIFGILATLLILVPVGLYRIKLEEEVLIKHFGKNYIEYMKKTKSLIPFIL